MGGLAYLTAEEMAAADRQTIDSGLGVETLMENAGVKTAELARSSLGGSVAGRKVAVMVGRGNNGGDGLVAARHLHNWGAEVMVMMAESRESLRDVPARQLAIVEKMGVRVVVPGQEQRAELLVDALLGYGAKGDPREPLASLIRKANASKVPILAVDLPSGLDATTGKPGDPCVMAKWTLTLGFPKAGFLTRQAEEFIGELYLADISLSRAIYEQYSCMGIFSSGPLVRLW